MTSSATRSRRTGQHAAEPVTGLPRPARRRRPLLVVAGLVLAALSAALVAALLNAATATALVWATAVDVSRGRLVESTELVAVEVGSTAAEHLIPATVESRDGLIGQVWAVDLPPGELLSPSLVTDRLLVADGQALVGLRLEPGGFPVAGLRPGDVVMVMQSALQEEEPRVLVVSAVVESVALLADQGVASARLVTLSVPVEAAAAVANAGSAGQASIAVVQP